MQRSITRVKFYKDRIYHIRLSNLQLEYFAKFILPWRNISPRRGSVSLFSTITKCILDEHYSTFVIVNTVRQTSLLETMCACACMKTKQVRKMSDREQ